MTILVFASTATAYLFSGLICYLMSLGHSTPSPYSRSKSQFLLDTSIRLWVAAFWPIWMVKEIRQEDESTETFAVKAINCSGLDRWQQK